MATIKHPLCGAFFAQWAKNHAVAESIPVNQWINKARKQALRIDPKTGKPRGEGLWAKTAYAGVRMNHFVRGAMVSVWDTAIRNIGTEMANMTILNIEDMLGTMYRRGGQFVFKPTRKNFDRLVQDTWGATSDSFMAYSHILAPGKDGWIDNILKKVGVDLRLKNRRIQDLMLGSNGPGSFASRDYFAKVGSTAGYEFGSGQGKITNAVTWISRVQRRAGANIGFSLSLRRRVTKEQRELARKVQAAERANKPTFVHWGQTRGTADWKKAADNLTFDRLTNDDIPVTWMEEAFQFSMNSSFSRAPEGKVTKALVDFASKIPFVGPAIAPFPRFTLANMFPWMLQRTPLIGLIVRDSGDDLAKVLAKQTTGVIGATMGFQVGMDEDQTLSPTEFAVPGEDAVGRITTKDLNLLAPITGPYIFGRIAGRMMKRLYENGLSEEWEKRSRELGQASTAEEQAVAVQEMVGWLQQNVGLGSSERRSLDNLVGIQAVFNIRGKSSIKNPLQASFEKADTISGRLFEFVASYGFMAARFLENLDPIEHAALTAMEKTGVINPEDAKALQDSRVANRVGTVGTSTNLSDMPLEAARRLPSMVQRVMGVIAYEPSNTVDMTETMPVRADPRMLPPELIASASLGYQLGDAKLSRSQYVLTLMGAKNQQSTPATRMLERAGLGYRDAQSTNSTKALQNKENELIGIMFNGVALSIERNSPGFALMERQNQKVILKFGLLPVFRKVAREAVAGGQPEAILATAIKKAALRPEGRILAEMYGLNWPSIASELARGNMSVNELRDLLVNKVTRSPRPSKEPRDER